MKKSLFLPYLLLLAVPVLVGCGKGDEAPKANASFKTYTDAAFKFVVRYPDGWVTATEPSQTRSHAIFYSSQQIVDGFTALAPQGNTGAKIEVVSQPGDSTGVAKSIADLREALADDPNAIKPIEQTTIGGVPATVVKYSFDLEGDPFTAERYLFVVDSVLTSLEMAVIGNADDYKATFDRVRTNFQPGRPNVAAAAAPGDTTVRDSIVVDPPAAEMKSYSGMFTMSYPANFNATSLSNGAVFSGARNDSKVQVNVYPTKGVTLDKIVESSKGNYGGRAASKASVGGQSAYVFNFSQGGASARAYYVVSGDNLYVITMTWFPPQKDLYLPAFDKMVGSFRPR